MRRLPIESRVTTASEDASPPAPDGARRSGSTSTRVVRGPRRGARLAALVAALAVVAAGTAALVGGVSGGAGPESGDGADGDTPDPQPGRAGVAYAEAVQRFRRAGSFAYRGTVHASGPSRLRPGEWLAEDVAVEGAVRLPQAITREVAVDTRGRAVETVTSGPSVWSRAAPSTGELGDESWREVEPSGGGVRDDPRFEAPLTRLGVALVSDILLRRCPGRDVALDGDGRRRLSATLPADVGGARYGDALAAGTVTITLDDAGDIARVVVESAGPGPQLVLDLAIERLGEPDVITPAGSSNVPRPG